MRKTTWLVGFGFGLVISLAGCVDDDSGATDAGDMDTRTGTQGPTDTVEATDTATVTDTGSETATTDTGADTDTTTVDIGAEWTTIPAGSFWMGTPDGSCPVDYPGGTSCAPELRRDDDEELHYVTLTYDFELMRTEVTQGQFAPALMGYNPSYFASCGDTCPVEQVRWHEALAFANALSSQAGYAACYDCTGTVPNVTCSLKGAYSKPQDCPGYRLPTESEWEYAARAGTLTAFYKGAITNTDCSPLDPALDAIGWYCGNTSDTTHPVAGKTPNAWGLYDMSGNVWEWTWDWYGTYPAGDTTSPVVDPSGLTKASGRVYRGGPWFYDAYFARSGGRGYSAPPVDSGNGLGFRLARSVP